MKVKSYKTHAGKLCWVKVNKDEALALIKSLVNQLQNGPNSGRLESRCSGDFAEISIAVSEDNHAGN
jgi:hypothetical protein